VASLSEEGARLQPPDRSGFVRQLPLLGGLLLTACAAASAITVSVAEPVYEFLLFAGLVTGILTSALGLRRGRLYALPGAIVMLLGLSLFGLRFANVPFVLLFYPPEVMAHEDLVLAAMVGWFLVAFSFWQSSRTNLIFLIVAGLAVFGLMGTVNLNVEMRFAFAVFVLGAVFCWSYEQFLDLDDRLARSGRPRVGNWVEMVRGHVSIAVLVGLLTFTAGSLVGTGAYRVSPNLYASMARRMYGWEIIQKERRLFNSFDNQFKVGTGPVRLLPVPVLEVRAERPALWRAMAYDHYDGRGWGRTLGQRGERVGGRTEGLLWDDPSGKWYVLPPEREAEARYGQDNRQTFEVLGNPGVIIAAAQPRAVYLPSRGRPRYTGKRWERLDPRPTVDSYGCITGTEGRAGRGYTVISREPVSDAETLRGAGTNYSALDESAYTTVPAVTDAALAGTVKTITTGLTNPYDRVMALMVYLQDNCLYSLGAPATPKGEDVAAHFVLRSKRGACDSFATALAVMARLTGVPARVAVGYQTGEYDAERGVHVVKGDDAHAWAEVYFPKYGWVPFDPQSVEAFEQQSLADLWQKGHWRWAVRDVARQAAWVLGIALIAFLGLAALVDPLRLLRHALRPRPSTALQRLSTEYRDFYGRLIRRAGGRPSPALTPQEAVQWLGQTAGKRLDRGMLQDLNDRFYDLRYAPQADPERVTAMRQELRLLRKRLRRL
jgi:hypothetical protein